MSSERGSKGFNPAINRRTFLKVSGTLASATIAGPVFTKSIAKAECLNVNQPFETGENCPDGLETAEDIIYSVCQMCHSRCGIRAKVKEGVLVKIDGNPYHPNNRDVDGNMQPDRLPYSTLPENAVNHLGRVCLKGQAGVPRRSLRSIQTPASFKESWSKKFWSMGDNQLGTGLL